MNATAPSIVLHLTIQEIITTLKYHTGYDILNQFVKEYP